MSKLSKAFYIIILALALNLQFFTKSSAQVLSASIRIDGKSQTARVSGGFSSRRNLSFLLSYAGINTLGNRVSNVSLFEENGDSVKFKIMVHGEYLAETDFNKYEYSIDLQPRDNRSAAHISWVSVDRGLLMLDDLLPINGRKGMQSGQLTWEIPEGWALLGREFEATDQKLARLDGSVVLVGKGWRSQQAENNSGPIDIFISGEWLFSDAEAAEMASEIFGEYIKIFGKEPASKLKIAITTFPNQTSKGAWQAETRGRTVTIVSSDMAFNTQSLQRLHEQLRHEIFHLWLPNGVNLTGNYDWFFEGFALYQSLKTAVALNRIRFEDFLDTLSRAHSIDSRQMRRLSLIEASTKRFSGMDTQVYARGMVVAFLTDLAMMQRSKGKRSVMDIFKELFAKYQTGPPVDGNTAVIGLVAANDELKSIIERYIRGSEKVDWASELATIGIESSEEHGQTILKVSDKLSGRQKTLLDKLGYNNWRKLSRDSK